MALDPRFITTSDLQSYFVDKDNGEPLAGGIVTFYSDTDPIVKKPVYQITETGFGGTYSYTPLPNPSVLSSVGTFQDELGNDIVPYYYPFTGDPDDDTGVQELYYITVEDSGGIDQFTRFGWPQLASGSGSIDAELAKNYIPNGQFLFHNEDTACVTLDSQTSYGGTVDISYLAQGGWEFQQTHGAADVYTIDYTEYDGAISGLDDYPRFSLNFACTTFSGGSSVRDILIQWPDVNKFSAAPDQPYTFFGALKSLDGGSHTFEVLMVSYFGTGGSPDSPVLTSLGNFISTTTFSYNQMTINFPDNSLTTKGTDGNDFVGIILRAPESTFSVTMTDFGLIAGETTIEVFPLQTDAEMLSQGIAGWMPTPNPDGSDLYLPLKLTPQGMQFDDSEIGSISAKANPSGTEFTNSISLISNELLCDGNMYIGSACSPLGIPYSRLQAKISNTSSVPIYGTGREFVTSMVTAGATNTIIMVTNKVGAVTAAADTGLTTFTISTLKTGSAGFGYVGWTNGSTLVTCVSNYTAASVFPTISPARGTSGMVVQNLKDQYDSGHYQAFTVEALSAATLGNGAGTGKYFVFSSSTTQYYMWFKTATEGDPAPGGTGIEVDLPLTFTAADVAFVIANVISGYQVTKIVTVPATTPIPPSSYFTFTADVTNYYAWYKISSSADPAVAGKTGIEIDITATDTAAQVATKTVNALNQYSFATPDLRGVFLRGRDTTGNWDIEYTKRFGYSSLTGGANTGSFEIDDISTHYHDGVTYVPGGPVGGTVSQASAVAGAVPFVTNANPRINYPTASNTVAGQSQGSESRPVNMFVNYAIRY